MEETYLKKWLENREKSRKSASEPDLDFLIMLMEMRQNLPEEA